MMKVPTSETSAIAMSTQAKIDDIKRHFLFRFGVFALAVAAGWFLSHLVYEGFRLLPVLGAGAHEKASPFLDVLRTLHSGFGH